MFNGAREHQEAIREGKRKAALYRIADPLWKAIAAGRSPEIARLQAALRDLVDKDRTKSMVEVRSNGN